MRWWDWAVVLAVLGAAGAYVGYVLYWVLLGLPLAH